MASVNCDSGGHSTVATQSSRDALTRQRCATVGLRFNQHLLELLAADSAGADSSGYLHVLIVRAV